MIYDCMGTYLGLGRIVAVTGVTENRLSSTAEAVFNVAMSGANRVLYFRAYERSALATVQLRNEHHKLLTAWHHFRAGRNLGAPSIYELGNLQLNLLGISAITEMTCHKIGMGGAGYNAAVTPAYEIYLLGLNDPIRRCLNETAYDMVEQLEIERAALLDAWRSFERPVQSNPENESSDSPAGERGDTPARLNR